MRLIDADSLINFANLHKGHKVDSNDIARFPAIEARPAVRGDWEMDAKNHCHCSNCHNGRNIETQIGWNFCPNCGAKMDGGNDDD